MKKILYIRTALSLMSIALLSSCLKDSKYTVDFTKTTPLVELPGAANVSTTAGLFEVVGLISNPTAASPFNVAVNIAAPQPLGKAVTVKLSADATALSSYNDATQAAYTADSLAGTETGARPPVYILLPAADYTSSLSVTIPAGQNLENVVVNVETSKLDPKIHYVLPLTITDGGGIQISNYKTILYSLTIKNIYDGLYTAKGFVFRNFGDGTNDPTLGGHFSGIANQPLATTGDFSVSWAPLWASGVGAGGVAGTTLTVDATTNKVTVASSTNATLANTAGYDSRYDPAAKVFYISYHWGNAATNSNRSEIDTLTYTGSR